jgi:hypothetical protein
MVQGRWPVTLCLGYPSKLQDLHYTNRLFDRILCQSANVTSGPGGVSIPLIDIPLMSPYRA